MDDLISEFVAETNESLTALDTELVSFERDPRDPRLLGNIFRLVHTIKGTCGFIGLSRLERIAHAAENILGQMRDGALAPSPTVVGAVLSALDVIRGLVGTIAATGAEPAGEDEALVARLNGVAAGETKTAAQEAADMESAMALAFAGDAEPAAELALRNPEPPADLPVPAPAGADNVVALPRAEAAPTPLEELTSTDPASAKTAVTQTIRVNVDVLEGLMTMVSELVLTRNQLLQILREQRETEFTAPLQRLSQVTSELQEGVMKTRMQPIGQAWSKLPRLIRDLALELDKKIELRMLGQETELDRQVIELIRDPLTHMVRNSCDHGLERPADRLAAGKRDVGTVTLNAVHEGGHIVIEVADDGRGLDLARIREKILSQGLATGAELTAMSDTEALQFIFKPGFSTAAKVTNVSGRGVGMDVVKTNIEKIGGTVELHTAAGKGSTFVIKIPLTLAIVSALIVGCGGERFAIPQIGVLELVRTGAQGLAIEELHGMPVLRLRDRLLPLVALDRMLKLDSPEVPERYIIITQVGAETFGIIVDQVFDTEEIVVKPVAPVMRNLPVFSGNTILGDGSVIMILDSNGIASAIGGTGAGRGSESKAALPALSTDKDSTTLLLFRAASGAPKAVPLALVSRLEEIDRATIEWSGEQPVVQYRGALMPLVFADPAIKLGATGQQAVIVFSDGTRAMGLMVDEILDIVEDRLQLQINVRRPGVLGTAIIAGRATDILDTGFYLGQASGDWFGASGWKNGNVQQSTADELLLGHGRKILLVDDSSFFRHLLTPVLAATGHIITSVASAADALALRENGEMFDVIVSDLEMPEMDGFAFAETVRRSGPWSHLPLLALSGHSSRRDKERSRAAGFNAHITKSDRDALLTTIDGSLTQMQGAA